MRIIRKFARREKGSILPITAVYLVVALGLLAVAIDLGHLFLVKSELQRVADASALTGALRLMTPSGGATPGVMPASIDCSRAINAAQAVGMQNDTDGQPTTLANIAVSLGTWNGTVFTDTGCASPSQVNAVQAVASRTTDVYFGGIITGSNTIDLSANATVLVGTVGGTYGAAPIAIDEDKVPSDGEPFEIQFYPNPGDGCWHVFKPGDFDGQGSSLIRDLINGTEAAPKLKVGDMIKVKNGQDNAAAKALQDKLAANGGTLDVMAPVIPTGQHTGEAEVLGFAALHLTEVKTEGNPKYIRGVTLDNYVAPGASLGGPNYGLYAGSPKMVQ